MESLTNAASAVSHAIFGGDEPSQEPLNGALGDTSKGEPYDAGNIDSTDTEKTNPKPSTSTPNTTAYTTELPVRPKKADHTTENMTAVKESASFGVPGNTTSTNPVQSELGQGKTGAIDTPEPSAAFTSKKPTSSNEPFTSGPKPLVSVDPSKAAQPSQKQQGADRPQATPNAEENDHIKDAKKKAEDAQAVDVSGPGPVPLEQVAKMGGATGVHAGGAGGDADGPQKESTGEGTGEKYVKSSGVKADGGDFDAANPGAGKEADRILEEKGVHRVTPISKPIDETNSIEDTEAVEGDKKPSLKEKIKAKLHKH